MRVKAFVMGTILLLILFSQNAAGNDYISNPGNIPFFDDFNSPNIKPGDSANFGFSVKNKYEDRMENVTITVGLYASATYYEYIEIKDIEKPPSLDGDGPETSLFFSEFAFNETTFVNVTVKTKSDTVQGTYFVRLQIEFDYNGSSYLMRSRGYYTDDEWEDATASANESSPGRINIEMLGIDGIIPDSSFKVWESIPLWPLYVCLIPTIVMLGILALLFYAQDEHNSFPWLDQGLKYWSGKFHQSWRLLKHRFRKA
jgi:hypothetical protein